MSDVLLSVANLTKVYGRGKLAVKVLDIANLVIEKRDFIAVTGPSGSGKTTLLNLLGALDRPTSGNIFFAGKNIFAQSEAGLCKFRRHKIGFVFQLYYLIPTLSVLKNVQAPAFPLNKDYLQRARELLELVGLAGKEDFRPNALSGGEQQRVAIARALLLDPELILADEPTGNLDSVTGAEIINLLKKLPEQGKTVVVAAHDRRVAKAGNRKIGLLDGQIV
ncbi:MAG: ABC transporter ATP-binding protein [Peptococcaceae bacterium]